MNLLPRAFNINRQSPALQGSPAEKRAAEVPQPAPDIVPTPQPSQPVPPPPEVPPEVQEPPAPEQHSPVRDPLP